MAILRNLNGTTNGDGRVEDVIAALDLLGRDYNPCYGNATSGACRLLKAPSGAMSIIDDSGERQYFKSYWGFDEALATKRDTPLTHSLCQIVRNTDRPLCITDARTDECLRGHPAHLDLGIVAYIGHPIRLPCGTPIGAICVFDFRPRTWGASEIECLSRFAASVEAAIRFISSAFQGVAVSPSVPSNLLQARSADEIQGFSRVLPKFPLIRRRMTSNQFLNGLWTGSIRPLHTLSVYRVTRLLSEVLPIHVHFMEDDDPRCGIRVLLDFSELEDGLTIGDAVSEETSLDVKYGSILIIAPTGVLQTSDDDIVAMITGQLAGEIMLLIISDGMIPIADENTTLFAMACLCRKLARGRLARAFKIDPDLFCTAMSAVLADYWSADLPDLSSSLPTRTSALSAYTAFQAYMQQLDPNFDVRDHVRPVLRLAAFDKARGFASWVRTIREELCDARCDRTHDDRHHV